MIDPEAQKLAEEFLEKKKAIVPEPGTAKVKPNILIGVPCFGGNVHCSTVNLLMDLSRRLLLSEIPNTTIFVENENLIPRARNLLASVAAFTNDSEGRPFSNLLFVDADISFQAEYVLEMLKANLPIIALPYTRKF